MKTIGVILYDLAVEYNFTVVNGIISYFENKKDTRVLITTVKVPHSENNFFDYQFWSSLEILKSKDIDGFIIIPNSFNSYMNFNTLTEYLKDFTKKPVVTVAVPLNISEIHYTYISCQQCYYDVINHLVTKHNLKRIAFFSAELAYSPEGEERLEAYKNALLDNHLSFDPDLVFPGDFTPGTANDYILSHYKSRKEMPFDAIVCVNDFTAAGCLMAFDKLNIECPKDIALFGFDDSSISSKTHPTLSTINQFIPHSGYVAGQMIYDLLNGKQVPEKNKIETYPIFRQSCGCIDCSLQTDAYIDKNGIFHGFDKRTIREQFEVNLSSTENLHNIYALLNMMDSYYSIDKIKTSLDPILNLTKVSTIAICLYKNILNLYHDETFELPEEAYLATYINRNKNINQQFFEDDNIKYFNPKESLLPENSLTDEPGIYYLMPVFLRSKIYGYMMCKYTTNNSYLVSIYSKILTNSIIQSYEYIKEEKFKASLLEKTENLTLQSKTDELTQLFNRRGFYEFSERLIELSIAVGKEGFVFFCDMDRLKKINDTYGHKVGDLAIKTQAKILTIAFRESDLIGRLSGDEFAVVAPGFKLSRLAELKERIEEISKVESKKANLPLILSISVGYEPFSEKKQNIQELLIAADKKLYEEKIIKHGKEK